MSSYGVTLLSGGLDSTTVTCLAMGQVENLSSITFHYGQSHSKEVECAKRIADFLRLDHQLMDISFLGEIAWYSALTNPERFPIPEPMSQSRIGYEVPITYVPLRNTIFLSLAAAYMESTILNAIEVHGENPSTIRANIYMAPNAIDYSGYPDCRPEFYEKAVETLNEGSKIAQSYGINFQVQTPIITMSKADIANMAVQIEAPIHLTWSCYKGNDRPCGTCDSCVLRAKGFEEAGLKDPALTQ